MLRRLLIRAFGLYRAFRLRMLGLRGRSEDDVHAGRVVSGQSWDEFCDTLKAAGAALAHGDAPRDTLSQAEGYRYLARLTRAGLEAFLEHDDPAFPTLRRMVHETVKMGADNPDNAYLNAQLDGRYRYRVHGHRGSVHSLGFGLQRGGYFDEGGLATSGYLDVADLVLDSGGRFEIILAPERPAEARNWLQMHADTSLLIVRQTFLDRDSETEADLTIEALDGPATPTPLSARALDVGLGKAAGLVAATSMLFARWANEFKSEHPNRLPRFDQERSDAAGGVPDIAYYHSYWQLGPDEALVIEAEPPPCESWNFQLNNWWMESLDYRYFQIHVNRHTAVYRPGGGVRVIVAHRDPGRDHWIDTAGHDRGTMCWRWQRPRVDDPPTPRCRVLPFAELAELPT
ncbi:MAG: hypothetical protein AAGC60_23975 [Acidobacteriota bacterium]